MTTAPKSALDILIEGRALIDTPDKWTQGSYFEGDKRCSDGALRKACWGATNTFNVYYLAYIRLAHAMGSSVCGFNDTHTHAEVLAAFDQAIAAERAAMEVAQ